MALPFSPYTSDNNFLVGAYVFEDVGVTPLIMEAASRITSPANLATAAGILAVEAYHAGLIRTTMNYIDPTGTGIASFTNLISTPPCIACSGRSAGCGTSPYDTNPDDFGLAPFQKPLISTGANVSRYASDGCGSKPT